MQLFEFFKLVVHIVRLVVSILLRLAKIAHIYNGVYMVYMHVYLVCVYGVSSRERAIHTVINRVYAQLWPALILCNGM
jgi:hypothetical protein